MERGDKSVVDVGQIKYRREMSLLSEVLIKENRRVKRYILLLFGEYLTAGSSPGAILLWKTKPH